MPLQLQHYLPLILFVAGLAAILYALFQTKENEEWLSQAKTAEGIIFSQHSDGRGDDTLNNIITVRFVTEELEWITATVKQQMAIYYTGQYKEGEKVQLMYNPQNPQQFKLLTKQNPVLAKTVFIIIGLLLMAIALLKYFYFNNS